MSTSTRRDPWSILFYQAGEPHNGTYLPKAGITYYLKVLVPASVLRRYTRTEDWGYRTVTLLDDHRSHVQCILFTRYLPFTRGAPAGRWDSLADTRVEWDGLPQNLGYFTFYSMSPVGAMSHGSEYYHYAEFFEGRESTHPKLHERSAVFQVQSASCMNRNNRNGKVSKIYGIRVTNT
ncbi:hypothetical protein GGS24DRAFT_500666 [Hypoxylon argillaceum]|nr:hypothetical protein GGS24DRAFT_500666 [Hypoxylon argillaceum]